MGTSKQGVIRQRRQSLDGKYLFWSGGFVPLGLKDRALPEVIVPSLRSDISTPRLAPCTSLGRDPLGNGHLGSGNFDCSHSVDEIFRTCIEFYHNLRPSSVLSELRLRLTLK
ncbi:hypothetical protein PM082_018314 [Marasmius tenuissimus]|nr:hypothetical protein PM082_018314 [Marasmius tenuissimus]